MTSLTAESRISASIISAQDRSAAISLTFHDAMATHLDIAAPILKKHQLNGTFFVSTALGVWEKRKEEWKQLAEEGNELGLHTVHHPCLLEEIQPHSQDYTPASAPPLLSYHPDGTQQNKQEWQ